MNPEILNHLNKSIRINPFFSDPYQLLASIYLGNKKYSLAIKNLKKAIDIEKKIIEKNNKEADTHFKLNNFSKIKIIQNKIDKSRLKLSEYSLMLAKIFYESDKKTDAVNYLKVSLQYDSELAEAYYYLSIIIPNKKKAQEYLDKAIEIDPEFSIK